MNNKNGLLNIIINIIIPTIILTKFSKEEYLGIKQGLVIALSFPILYGSYEFIREKKINFFSVLGLISVLLTGVIGLVELEGKWIAIKEASVPLVLGLFVFFSRKTKFAIVTKVLNTIINFKTVEEEFEKRNIRHELDSVLEKTHIYLSLNFLFSVVLNYALAVYIVQSPTGTEAFNEEIGKMTALSFPVIGIPTGICFTIILLWLFKFIEKKTEIKFDDLIPTKASS